MVRTVSSRATVKRPEVAAGGATPPAFTARGPRPILCLFARFQNSVAGRKAFREPGHKNSLLQRRAVVFNHETMSQTIH